VWGVVDRRMVENEEEQYDCFEETGDKNNQTVVMH
jgi:hypothetical protein